MRQLLVILILVSEISAFTLRGQENRSEPVDFMHFPLNSEVTLKLIPESGSGFNFIVERSDLLSDTLTYRDMYVRFHDDKAVKEDSLTVKILVAQSREGERNKFAFVRTECPGGLVISYNHLPRIDDQFGWHTRFV